MSTTAKAMQGNLYTDEQKTTIHTSTAGDYRKAPGSQGWDRDPVMPCSQWAYSQPRGTCTTPRASAAGTERSWRRGGLLTTTSLGVLFSGQDPSMLHDLSPQRTSASAKTVTSHLRGSYQYLHLLSHAARAPTHYLGFQRLGLYQNVHGRA
jgi:hypothetical protein